MYSKKIIISIYICFFILRDVDSVLNKHDEEYFDTEADQYKWSSHPCHRDCEPNEPPKTCYYVFVVETYSTMSKACYDCPRNLTDCNRSHCIPADGVQRTIHVVNRQMPGPSIEVCQNDKIVVDVRNKMLTEVTTIHWHGIKQYGTPYMDGVPFVTQCPILPGQSFRYSFNASSAGTFYWHSHIGNQLHDGVYGSLIIRPAFTQDVHKKLYDYDDQIMIINDWSHLHGDGFYIRYHHYATTVSPDTILVNGKGRSGNFLKNELTETPLAVFKVKINKKHRFRVIHAGTKACPIEISIDKHTLLAISLDGNNIDPIEVDVITVWPGERFDFVLETNQKPGNYWINFRGHNQCKEIKNSNAVFRMAVLQYDTVPFREPKSEIGWNLIEPETTRVLNFDREEPYLLNRTDIDITQVRSTESNDLSVTGAVDQQIFISFDYFPKDNYEHNRKGLYGYNQVPKIKRIGSNQMNHISLVLQPFPLLPQRESIKPESFCNSTNLPSSCIKEQCACTHVLQVKLNSIVELVLVNDGKYGDSRHPLHLHGHSFRILSSVGLEKPINVETVKQFDREGKIKRSFDRAPIKDTIRTLNPGYAVIRFYANNPGYWPLHCHYTLHNDVGMALIFKVGEHEDFPPVPKNFPTCRNFEPDF